MTNQEIQDYINSIEGYIQDLKEHKFSYVESAKDAVDSLNAVRIALEAKLDSRKGSDDV